MVRLWRSDWASRTGIESLSLVPFGFVQIGPRDCIPCEDHQGATGTFYGGIRWSQTAFLYNVPNTAMPNTFMAVSADLAEGYSPVLPIAAGCVHYGNKQDVGARLAIGVRKYVYNESSLVAAGPMLVSIKPVSAAGLELTFDSALEVRNASGFEVSTNGADYTAAAIASHTAFAVTLAAPTSTGATATIVSLRYILHDTPCINKTCAIYGTESGLPSPPLVANLPGHAGADPVGWNLTAQHEHGTDAALPPPGGGGSRLVRPKALRG